MRRHQPFMLAMLLLLSSTIPGCLSYTPRPGPTPGPSATPTSMAIPTPPITPTPLPHVEFAPGRAGGAVVYFTKLDKAPLTCQADVQALATFLWDLDARANPDRPILELQVMGNTPMPCLVQGCNNGPKSCKPDSSDPDWMGLRVRYSANKKNDRNLPENQHCGAGINYNHRMALGPLDSSGGVRVGVSWDPSGITIETPAETRHLPAGDPESGERYYSPGFSGVILGTRAGIGWVPPALSADKWATMNVESWSILDPNAPTQCPPQRGE